MGLGEQGESSSETSWVKIVLGVLLVLLAVRQWRGRPRPGADAPLPRWMSAIETFTFGKATGLAFVLAAVNPKNLLMCVAAGVAIGGAGLSTGQDVIAIVVFTGIAACTVAIPVIGHAVARDRMRAPLDGLESWLRANNAAVMSVLLLVIGVVLLGKGIAVR